nr:protein SIEVE ELEMENT OCCLUSION B-like [Coffea arabica]
MEMDRVKEVLDTHVPDGRDFDVKPLVPIVEDIMKRATFLGGGAQDQDYADTWEDTAIRSGYTDMPELTYAINKTINEIICNCSSGGDEHFVAIALCRSLSRYAWEDKVAIALAAFAVSYGKFWLVAQLRTTNPLAKSLAVIRELPEIIEHTEALKRKFEAVSNLSKAMLNVTSCIINLKELPIEDIGQSNEWVFLTAHVPTAVYWTVRSIAACSFILNLTALGPEYVDSAAEAWDLNGVAHKLAKIKEDLKEQMNSIKQKIEDKRQDDAYNALVELFKTPNTDNTKILSAVINVKEDQLPLYDGTNKKRASIDILRKKHVLLLISELHIPQEEPSILHQFYTESRQQPTKLDKQYEVVWLPVVDTFSNATDEQFELVQNSMPWYSVHPIMLEPAFIRFIKDVKSFDKTPQLLVLHPRGILPGHNARDMMWVWGNLAFPFTEEREKELWTEATLIELLADSIHQNLLLWADQNRYICLYGGADIEWIRRLTTIMRSVANTARIPLEMLYVGKKNPKESMRKNNFIIQAENLSHILPDLIKIQIFWMRLDIMLKSWGQHGMFVKSDLIHHVGKIICYDQDGEGWAFIARGRHEMAKGTDKEVYQCLSKFDEWKDKVVYPDGFVIALGEQLRELQTPHHCNRLILPESTGHIHEKVACPECGRPMESFIMYLCCTD